MPGRGHLSARHMHECSSWNGSWPSATTTSRIRTLAQEDWWLFGTVADTTCAAPSTGSRIRRKSRMAGSGDDEGGRLRRVDLDGDRRARLELRRRDHRDHLAV